MTNPEAAGSKPPSVWEDFIDIFYAPSQVFARRENGKFGLALLILTLALTALYFATKAVLEPVFDAEFDRQMATQMRQNPQLTPEAVEQMRGVMSMMAPLFALIGTPVIVCITGVVLWLVGKLFDSQATLRSAFVVATYSWVPRILEGVINAVQGAVLDASAMKGIASLSIGPARLLDPDTTSPVLVALALRLDLFTIWATVLLAIGIRVTGKVSSGKAAAIAVLSWLLLGAFSILGALRQ